MQKIIHKPAPALLGVVEVQPKEKEFLMGDVIPETVDAHPDKVYSLYEVEKKTIISGWRNKI